MKELYLHNDFDCLRGKFIDRLGNKIIVTPEMFGYFMQGSSIVKIVYSSVEAERYLAGFDGKVVTPIYTYVESEDK